MMGAFFAIRRGRRSRRGPQIPERVPPPGSQVQDLHLTCINESLSININLQKSFKTSRFDRISSIMYFSLDLYLKLTRLKYYEENFFRLKEILFKILMLQKFL